MCKANLVLFIQINIHFCITNLKENINKLLKTTTKVLKTQRGRITTDLIINNDEWSAKCQESVKGVVVIFDYTKVCLLNKLLT